MRVHHTATRVCQALACLACLADLAGAQSTGTGACAAELAQTAEAITSVCCAGSVCAGSAIPGSCSSPCAELLAPLARRCGDFLAEAMEPLTPLIQLCLERDGGIGSGTIEPSGEIAWPPCDHDDWDTSSCEESIASGLSCGSLFCPECGGLAHKCDMTCSFPCPTEGVQFPPDQPFLFCFEATCGTPLIDGHGGQVCARRLRFSGAAFGSLVYQASRQTLVLCRYLMWTKRRTSRLVLPVAGSVPRAGSGAEPVTRCPAQLTACAR